MTPQQSKQLHSNSSLHLPENDHQSSENLPKSCGRKLTSRLDSHNHLPLRLRPHSLSNIAREGSSPCFLVVEPCCNSNKVGPLLQIRYPDQKREVPHTSPKADNRRSLSQKLKTLTRGLAFQLWKKARNNSLLDLINPSQADLADLREAYLVRSKLAQHSSQESRAISREKRKEKRQRGAERA